MKRAQATTFIRNREEPRANGDCRRVPGALVGCHRISSRGEVGIISIILIIIVSNDLLFYFQNITEHDLRNSLFEEQKQRQLESTKEISQHIGSDTSLVLTMLHGLANSGYFTHPSNLKQP